VLRGSSARVCSQLATLLSHCPCRRAMRARAAGVSLLPGKSSRRGRMSLWPARNPAAPSIDNKPARAAFRASSVGVLRCVEGALRGVTSCGGRIQTAEIHLRIRTRESGPGQRKSWIQLHRPFVKADNLLVIVWRGHARVKSQPAKIGVVSLRIVCRLSARACCSLQSAWLCNASAIALATSLSTPKMSTSLRS